MQSKYNKAPNSSQSKESMGESVLDYEERDLVIESFAMLLKLIHAHGVLINGDREFTRHICKEISTLAVRLEYDATEEREIH